MLGLRAATRAGWVSKALGAGHKFTAGQARRAFHLRRFEGWHTAAQPDGPALEKVVLIHDVNPLVDLVDEYVAGERWFEIAIVDQRLGASISSVAGARRLAKAGFAIVQADDGRVQLAVTDPRAARFVNEARILTTSKGFSARAVVEAFYAPRQPGRKRVNFDRNGNRRIEAAIILEEKWGIECPDLLSARRRVRLVSKWMFSAAA